MYKYIKKVRGFTLIEILIVIVIIGILAIAFVPKVLQAPVKARDRQKIEDVKEIAAYLQDQYLNGQSINSFTDLSAAGTGSTCLTPAMFAGSVKAVFGGRVPIDPKQASSHCPATGKTGYSIYRFASDNTNYRFAIVAKVELPQNGNSRRPSPPTTPLVSPPVTTGRANQQTSYYAVLIQK